jgi:hypothetical protein
VGQAEVRTAGGEGRQSHSGRIEIGFLDTSMGPVGNAQCTDFAALYDGVERFHQSRDRNRGVIPMKEIEIDVFDPKPSKGCVKVFDEKSWMNARNARRIGMSSFPNDEDSVAYAAFTYPLTQDAFAQPTPIDGRGVESRAARIEGCIEHRVWSPPSTEAP